MEEKISKPTDFFGTNLAKLLSDKIARVYPAFNSKLFIAQVNKNIADKTLTQRIEWIAEQLQPALPAEYPEAIRILHGIMGPENPAETGMFKEFYWLMPVGKYIEKYGLDHFDISMKAIEELTKRNTGEYAIRPFIRKYPKKTVQKMKVWSRSKNFHLRRLASEGLRPKLPWSLKLDLFVENPAPVFEILENLKTEPIKFVKKSVANNLTDYLKVNHEAAMLLIRQWQTIDNEHTQWMVKYAMRKMV